MGRIRSIKPEFPHSESMGKVSREARLLFILLWTLVDDLGRTRAASRMLASLLYPYDSDAPKLIDRWLRELINEGCIRCYVVDGGHYLEVCNWHEHQKIDRPSQSKIPPFDEGSRGLGESSRGLVGGLDLDLDQEGIKEGRGGAARPLAIARPSSVSEEVWQAFLQVRKARRAKLTPIAFAAIEREAAKAGLTLEQALQKCAERNWQSFEAEWLTNGKANGKAAKPVEHMRNMPLGHPPCGCAECVAFRSKQKQVAR